MRKDDSRKVVDVGEVIAGARKHGPGLRKLMGVNYHTADPSEYSLTKIWPVSAWEWRILIDKNGLSPWRVSLCRAIREQLPQTPAKWRLRSGLSGKEDWLASVRRFAQFAEGILGNEDLMRDTLHQALIAQDGHGIPDLPDLTMDWEQVIAKARLYEVTGNAVDLRAVTILLRASSQEGPATWRATIRRRGINIEMARHVELDQMIAKAAGWL